MANFRGGGPAPSSLLDLMAPQGGGAAGGAGGLAAAGGAAGLLTPEALQSAAMTLRNNGGATDSNYGLWGNAQQNIGAPPAFAERGDPHSFPGILSSAGAPTTGWFTLDDYYKQSPNGGIVPSQFQAGSSLPSTNNWRLLPPDWRKPGNFMVNGHIIDRSQLQADVSPRPPYPEGTGPPSAFPAHGAGYPWYWMNSPTYAASIGYLGQIDNKVGGSGGEVT